MPTKKETKTSNTFESLNYIQVRLNAPKGQKNNFGNYSYRSLEDIFQALKPLLSETGCYCKVSDEIVLVGERYYIKATAVFGHPKSQDEIESTGWARESFEKKGMDSSQITGSTSSYARKYAMNGLFAIDNVEDADSWNNVEMNYTITNEQKAEYQKLLKHDLFKGIKAETNKWWGGLWTKEQAASGLKQMQGRIDAKDKKKEKVVNG